MPALWFTLAAFVNPALFYAGAAAVSIPVIIHLLNKRRFRVVTWAAMEFLLAAQRRNARRLKFQRWLLLALRCAALLILAAAIAQFYLQESAIGSILGGGERAFIVIWDDSYSMAYRPPGKPSHFETSRKLLTDWVAGLPSSDKVAVVRASSGSPALIDKPTLDHHAVRQALATQEVSDGATDLPAAFDRTLEAIHEVERTARSKTVLLVTDLSRSSMAASDAAGEGGAREAIKRKLAQITRQARFRVVDVGEQDQSNHGITDMKTRRPMVVAGMPTELQVTVQNATETPLVEHPLMIRLDGLVIANEKMARIGPGESRTITVALTIGTPGRHILEATIPTDLLPVDDVRRLVVQVTRELPILLVDGNPGDTHTLGSTTFLQTAYGLSVDGKTNSIFAPRVISELELPRTPLGTVGERSAYVAIVLSDTGRMDPATIAMLKQYVEQGGLLMIFPGNRTNANDMNQMLGEAGAKLLPASYGQLARLETGTVGAGEGIHFDPMNYAHPVLEPFAAAARGGQNTGLTGAQVSRYLRMAVPQDGSVETVLKYSDGAPGVIAKRVGKGRAVQFASTADTSWNTFPARPSFLPFMWELLFYGLSREGQGLTLDLGASVHLPADAAPAGSWNGPSGMKLQIVTTVDDQRRGWITSGPLTRAGLYGPSSPGAQAVVAVNPDGREADIRYAKPAEMAATLGISASEIVSQPRSLEMTRSSSGGPANHGNDFGLRLILVALGLFALETLMARLFSVYR